MYSLFVTRRFSLFELVMFVLLAFSNDAICSAFSPLVAYIFITISALSVLFIGRFIYVTMQAIDEYYNHGLKGKNDGK